MCDVCECVWQCNWCITSLCFLGFCVKLFTCACNSHLLFNTLLYVHSTYNLRFVNVNLGSNFFAFLALLTWFLSPYLSWHRILRNNLFCIISNLIYCYTYHVLGKHLSQCFRACIRTFLWSTPTASSISGELTHYNSNDKFKN